MVAFMVGSRFHYNNLKQLRKNGDKAGLRPHSEINQNLKKIENFYDHFINRQNYSRILSA